jgi:hypothetical protein
MTSLLSILFLTLHLADDLVRGFAPGGPRHYTGILIVVVWLYATLVLAGRRSGYIIILIAFAAWIGHSLHPHKTRGTCRHQNANSGGKFWVSTLLAIGVTTIFSVLLSARGRWNLRRGQRVE